MFDGLKLACALIVIGTFAYFTNRSAVDDVNKKPLDKELNATNARRTTVAGLDRSKLELCPITPPDLLGHVNISMVGLPMKELEDLYAETVSNGGRGKPADCLSRYKVAVIVPFRERESHLRVFLYNLHSFLAKQQLDYGIFVVEQIANQTFNRAKLMNVGYVESLKVYPWDCFVFHDVDLIPLDDRNIYSCPTQPRHLSIAMDKFYYRLPYEGFFGGVSVMTREQMNKTNGFSNDYWGWGSEDDDLYTRVGLADYIVFRYPLRIGGYRMINHTRESANSDNKCRLKLAVLTRLRWKIDGLTNLKYTALSIKEYPLYTHLLVDLKYEESYNEVFKDLLDCN